MAERNENERNEKNFRSGGNMGAGKSGREDLGPEKSADEQGSHRPGEAPSRDAAIDHVEQLPNQGAGGTKK